MWARGQGAGGQGAGGAAAGRQGANKYQMMLSLLIAGRRFLARVMRLMFTGPGRGTRFRGLDKYRVAIAFYKGLRKV